MLWKTPVKKGKISLGLNFHFFKNHMPLYFSDDKMVSLLVP